MNTKLIAIIFIIVAVGMGCATIIASVVRYTLPIPGTLNVVEPQVAVSYGLSSSVSNLPWGNVEPGESTNPQPMTVTNTGNQPVYIHFQPSATLPTGVSMTVNRNGIVYTPTLVQPSASISVTVMFSVAGSVDPVDGVNAGLTVTAEDS